MSDVVDVMAEWGVLDVWCALSLVTAPPPTPAWQARLLAAAAKEKP